MKPGTKWVIAIVALLAINALAAIILIVVSSNGARSTVLPSYRIEAR